ncbi:hypothetical protein BGZ96_010874 [Linnemannia gamsii]|uniref:Uncharacterized protein n=1 Tax=Linnemannia gamsii TaxID=64522 RepID=A0ABQ7JTL2_9FUNG|nr:hypothetical protein BGZ96_010874 [Linnemannia gamsii]
MVVTTVITVTMVITTGNPTGLTIRDQSQKLAIANPDGTPYYEKTNLCRKADCKKIASVTYVNLNGPCSPNPSDCAAALGSQYPPVETDTDETLTEKEYEDDEDEPEADESDADNASDSFEGLNNGGHHRHRHHHKRHGHHHHKKDGRYHHKHKPGFHHHKSRNHPWAGLCTSTGPVCGSEHFGCDFIPTALYYCDGVTGYPSYVGSCAYGCGGGGICDGLVTPNPGTTSDGGVKPHYDN